MEQNLKRRRLLSGMAGAISTPLIYEKGTEPAKANIQNNSTGCPYPNTSDSYSEETYEERWRGSDTFEIGCCPGGGDGRILEIIHSIYHEFTIWQEEIGYQHYFFSTGHAQSAFVDYYGNQSASNSINQVSFGVDNMDSTSAQVVPYVESSAGYPEPDQKENGTDYSLFIDLAYTAAKYLVSYGSPKIKLGINAAELASALNNEYTESTENQSTWSTSWNWNEYPCQASHFNRFMMDSHDGEHTASFSAYSHASDAAAGVDDVEFKDYYHVDPLDCSDPNDPCPNNTGYENNATQVEMLANSDKFIEVPPKTQLYQKIKKYQNINDRILGGTTAKTPRTFLAVKPKIRTGRAAVEHINN